MADHPAAASWISRLRPAATRDAADWADYGTAFGLDRSMDDPSPAVADAAPSPAAAPSRRWWHRWAGGAANRR